MSGGAQGAAIGCRRGRLGAVLVALVVAASVLAGCASVRDNLGTADSNCYVGLPAAVGAVHHHGHLAGMRLVPVSSLQRKAPLLYLTARAASGTKATQVCLVAFAGDFAARAVERPEGRPAGHLAVVELGYPSTRLYATLLVRRAPLSFGHTRA